MNVLDPTLKFENGGGNETVLLEQPLKSIHNNTGKKFAKWNTAVHTFLGNISQGT